MKVSVVKNEAGNTLVIEIPMNQVAQPSATGKTLVVASSKGNKVTDAVFDGQPITVGLNAYIYPKKG